MTKEVAKTFSTTQIAGTMTIGLTLYNMAAQNSSLSEFTASPDQLMACATLLAPALTSGYMMWRRMSKSKLKWGFLK